MLFWIGDGQMKHMTLKQIAAACGGTYYGSESDKDKSASGVETDSRRIEKGFLFVPIKGARVDGHSFIPEVFSKGALAVLSEHVIDQPAGPYILVDSAEEAMKKIAGYYRRALDVKVVGVIGSVGKTSTKEMIASVLSQKYRVLKTEGNLNNEIGLPLTIFKIRGEHEIAVLEMGISDFGEMNRLAKMAEPDICVITNIGYSHLERLISRDGILKAKTECFSHMKKNGLAVLNGDDDKLCDITEVNGRPVLFYGLGKEPFFSETPEGKKKTAEKQIYATDIKEIGLTKTEAVIHIADCAGEKNFSVEIPIAGRHNAYNALAAVSAALELGLTLEEMKRGIESVHTIAGRNNLIQKDGITIIDDCYNANPVSMRASIDVLAKAPGRKIAVLGDMGELGADTKRLHYEIGAHFKGKGVHMLYCTGILSREIVSGAEAANEGMRIRHFETKDELAEALKKEIKRGDTVLVKASHFMEFPEIVKKLQA